MPITVDWYDENSRIFIFEVIAPWSVEDVKQALNASADYEDGPHPIAILYDVRRAGTVPRSFLSVVRTLQQSQSKQVRIRALVGANHTLRLLYKIIDRAFPSLTEGFIFTETIEEAVHAILEIRMPSMDKLTADG